MDCKDAYTKEKFIQEESGSAEEDGEAESDDDEMRGFWTAARIEERLHERATNLKFLCQLKFQKKINRKNHIINSGMFGMICRRVGSNGEMRKVLRKFAGQERERDWRIQ